MDGSCKETCSEAAGAMRVAAKSYKSNQTQKPKCFLWRLEECQLSHMDPCRSRSKPFHHFSKVSQWCIAGEAPVEFSNIFSFVTRLQNLRLWALQHCHQIKQPSDDLSNVPCQIVRAYSLSDSLATITSKLMTVGMSPRAQRRNEACFRSESSPL